jgi:hypothetical protein
MNLKKHRVLLFVLSALLVTVCRCNADPLAPDYTSIGFTDGSRSECRGFVELLEENPEVTQRTYVYECKISCPDGSTAEFELYEMPSPFNPQDKIEYQMRYCPPVQSEAVAFPTETPTVSPTDTPSQEPPPEVNEVSITPVLAGSVTACDTGLRFINFPLVSPLPDLTGKNAALFINGTRVSCRIAGSQQQLLGCSLPERTVFPINVRVTLDDVEVNNFSFDGAICVNTEPTRPASSEESAPSPVPTPDCDGEDYYDPFCS